MDEAHACCHSESLVSLQILPVWDGRGRRGSGRCLHEGADKLPHTQSAVGTPEWKERQRTVNSPLPKPLPEPCSEFEVTFSANFWPQSPTSGSSPGEDSEKTWKGRIMLPAL